MTQILSVKPRSLSAPGISFEVAVDAETKVIYQRLAKGEPNILLASKCQGQWYYQFMMWSCRAGRHHFFRAMVHLYRHLRRHKITDYSLRYLACADKRLKHGGYAIRTDSHRRLLEIGARLEAEQRVSDGTGLALPEIVDSIAELNEWQRAFTIGKTTRAVFYTTNASDCAEFISVKIDTFGMRIVRLTGRPRKAMLEGVETFEKLLHTPARLSDDELIQMRDTVEANLAALRERLSCIALKASAVVLATAA